MGCWNETCMLTGLPIRLAEPCAAFLLRPRGDVIHERIEPDAFYKPILPAIHGEYDDYGGIESIKAPDGFIPALLLNNFLIKNSDGGYAPIQNYSETLDCFEKIIQLVNDERLVTVDRKPVQLVLVHEDFYQMAIAAAKKWNIPTKYSKRPDINSEDKLEQAYALNYVDDNNMSQLQAFDSYMRRMRRTWYPTTGAGSQTSIETKDDLEFYEAVHERARQIYYSERT